MIGQRKLFVGWVRQGCRIGADVSDESCCALCVRTLSLALMSAPWSRSRVANAVESDKTARCRALRRTASCSHGPHKHKHVMGKSQEEEATYD